MKPSVRKQAYIDALFTIGKAVAPDVDLGRRLAEAGPLNFASWVATLIMTQREELSEARSEIARLRKANRRLMRRTP
jgi:hypothetical protein